MIGLSKFVLRVARLKTIQLTGNEMPLIQPLHHRNLFSASYFGIKHFKSTWQTSQDKYKEFPGIFESFLNWLFV